MLNAVYLSGWEYNRVPRAAPTDSVVSGLPAQVLWDGAAQFWLFETVYCTKEALLGDIAAYESLGWTTGKIFEDLAKRGFLRPVDWSCDAKALDADDSLGRTHTLLQQYYTKEDIRRYLEEGDDAELESIKLRLLSPLLKALRCVKNVSPNSIRHWIPSQRMRPASPAALSAGRLLADALGKSTTSLRAGFRLCDPPGTGLDPSVIETQRRVEREVQRPLIPALLEGSLPQEEYHAALAPTCEVYQPVNRQLWRNYSQNIATLERLRDIAKQHLWPDLHNEWLPALEADPRSLPYFTSLLKDAVLRARFDPYLKFVTQMVVTGVSVLAGVKMTALSGSTSLGTTTSIVSKELLDNAHTTARKKSDNVAVFLQKAR